MTDTVTRKAFFEQAPAVVGEIAELVVTGGAERQEVMTILADTRRALKRAVRRAETLSGEWERIEINQARGPRIEFTGRLLAETQFETRGEWPVQIKMEIWQTKAGAMIGATYSAKAGYPDTEEADAVVVPYQENEQAMRFAILDHFEWDLRARSMVTKKLGWGLRLDVE
jgi:hypothetical protein